MEEREVVEVRIGKEFPLYKIKAGEKVIDGAIFEAAPEGEGYSYQVYLRDMTIKERDAIAQAPVSVRVMKNVDGLILTLFKFGSANLIFEVEFDPTLYEDDRGTQLVRSCNLLQIYGIESTNNIVQAIRLVSIPAKLSEIWSDSWEIAYNNLNFSQEYKEWCSQIKSTYNTSQLWERATYVGKLGSK